MNGAVSFPSAKDLAHSRRKRIMTSVSRVDGSVETFRCARLFTVLGRQREAQKIAMVSYTRRVGRSQRRVQFKKVTVEKW